MESPLRLPAPKHPRARTVVECLPKFEMTTARRDGAEAARDYAPDLMKAMPGSPVTKWASLNGWLVALVNIMGRITGTPGAPAGVKSRAVTDGPASLVVHEPPARVCPSPSPLVVHIHGGGTVTGSPESFAPAAGGYAKALGVPVVAFRYRLAPANRFPAALDDCIAAWAWVQAHAKELDIDINRVAFVGDSAGGLLVASVCMKLRDQGLPLPAAILLNYPMLDDRTSARPDMKKALHPFWTNGSNVYGWTSYLGQAPGAPAVPKYAVPGRCSSAELVGLPPTWIGVGSADIFHDEVVEFAEKLKQAGVDVQLNVAPKAFHLFDTAAHPLAKGYNKSKFTYLSKRLGLPEKKPSSKL